MKHLLIFLFSFTTLLTYAQICPNCPVPNNFNVTTTDSTAVIDWADLNDALFYNFRYRQQNGSYSWNYIYNIYNNNIILSTLIPNTEYEFQVRSNCFGGYSCWSNNTNFLTQQTLLFDCNGDQNGTAIIDNCGDCVLGNTNLSACVQDCNGDYGGTAIIDNCGNCVQGNTNLSACVQDCNGDYGGTAIIDNCGDCVQGNTNLSACVQDCNGDYGGTAIIDNCGDCVQGNTNLSACVQDCNGDYGGTAIIDNCGDCVQGNTNLSACVQDCNGDYGGTAIIDNCGDCVQGNTNLSACVQDCNGDYGGTAIIDNCGNCSLPSEICISFSPITITTLSNTNCDQLSDLTIMVEQDPNEPDIQNSLYWSDDGAFDINSLTVFDTIGSGFLNTDGGNIIINTILVVTSIPTNNQAIISAYDVTSNNIVGNFTINNLNPGIYITATSPGDNNNITDGNYSVGVFENIFINPSYPTTIEFTSNINSELGDASIEMQYININCTNTIEENIIGNEIFPNPNNGIFLLEMKYRPF